MPELALEGGRPVRDKLLSYGRQAIDDSDVDAVVSALRSDWLTTGPEIGRFEDALEDATGAAHAVAISSGTAALHAAMHALGVSADDEIIVPTLTFAASANAVLYAGATPVLVDVRPDTLLVDPAAVEAAVTPRTRGVIAVDYAGQPCDYDELNELCSRHDLFVVSDAAHALGARYKGRPVGTLGRMTTFSFHPVKHVTTGEGGAVTTDDPALERRARRFRNHGISSEHHERERRGSWHYDMEDLGYNYRITDFQAALGRSQLSRLDGWIRRRREIAARYDDAFAGIESVRPLARLADREHAYHLYVVRLALDTLRASREQVFAALRAEGIGVNVHYIPVHFHSYYRARFGWGPGMCPVAEAAYEDILTLPLFPTMSDADVEDVVEAVSKVCAAYAA